MHKPFKKTRIVRNFVRRNKPRVIATVAVVSTGIVLIQRKGLKLHDEFLIEKGLYDEYYAPETAE